MFSAVRGGEGGREEARGITGAEAHDEAFLSGSRYVLGKKKARSEL